VSRNRTNPKPPTLTRRPFRVRNAACAKCDGSLWSLPGEFPGCPTCGRVKLRIPGRKATPNNAAAA
jgi:hypothetical protein